MSHDEDQLLALLAAQLSFVAAEKLEAAGEEWLKRRHAGIDLGKILLEQGALTGAQLAFLQKAVSEVAAAHGGAEGARQALGATASPLLHRSLGAFDTTLRSGEHAVPSDSLDGVELVSHEAPGRYTPARTVSGETEILGKGGLGVVTTVTDAFVGRQVAMKQLHTQHVQEAQKDTVTSTALEARFLREARVTGQLEHPGVVPVFEIGRRADDSLYYTMRRIKGRTLSEAIARAKTLPERMALLPSVLTVCQAVAYAHSRHVIHRDLKPQNVMLGDFGETYLLDWGLARVKGKKDLREEDVKLAPDVTGSRHAGVVGTPAYMSPEQARGETSAVDERSDVWGLGGLVYETLTGRAPFVGKSPWDVIAAVSTEPVTPLRTVVAEVPLDLAALCEKALQKDPGARYQSAKELAKDLEAFLNGRRVSAYAYSGREVLGRFVRRYRAVLAVAAAALAGLAALGVASVVRIREERNEAREFARLVIGDVGQHLHATTESQLVLDAVTRRADAFYRRIGLSSLPPDELDQLGYAWSRLGDVSRRVGRAEKAEESLHHCLETVEAQRTSPPRPAALANEVECITGFVRTSEVAGKRPESAEWLKRADALVERWGDHWPEVPRWQEAISYYSRVAGQRTIEADDPEKALTYLQRALKVDETMYARTPTDTLRLRLVVSSAQLQLVLWSLDHKDEAVQTGARALPLTQGDVSTFNSDTLSTVASFLRQHGMLLGWAGRDAERRRLLERSEVLIKHSLVRDPKDMVARAEYGDLLLELGRTEEAWAQYQQISPELKADYLLSGVLTAFLAGHDEEVLARRKDVEAAADAQALWVLATVLAAQGHGKEAAALLPLAPDLNTPLQFPREALFARADTLPEGLRAAYLGFLKDAEAAMANPLDNSLEPSYRRYFEALAKLPPAKR